MSSSRLRELVPALGGRQIVVLGDLILDEYLIGRPTRISREAPVLVLEFARRFCRPGGAGNPAVNIQALGSSARLVAVVGDDGAGQTAGAELERAGLDAASVIVHSGASTATKTRLLAEDSSSRQHLARLDYRASPPDAVTRTALLARLRQATEGAEAILISDYKAGAIEPETLETARALADSLSIRIMVDSQGDLLQFVGFDLVKCNQAEAEATLGRELRSIEAVERAGAELLELLRAHYVVLTRGADGLSAFERGRLPLHLPAANRTEVFDVTGAGDTVIAVLTLALTAGAALQEAAELANLAAGLVVRRLGVATTSPHELLAAIDQLDH
jgi:D-glycero-beta-D-manno-heptose-7-phosphate kinase